MKCINCTGTIRIAHELVDVTTPGFFCIITCCWLKCSKDGRKKWWGRRGGISINISKTKGEKKINHDESRSARRWQIKHTVREVKFHEQLQHLSKNTHDLPNYFWRLAGLQPQWGKISKLDSLSSGHSNLHYLTLRNLCCFVIEWFGEGRLKFHRRIELRRKTLILGKLAYVNVQQKLGKKYLCVYKQYTLWHVWFNSPTNNTFLARSITLVLHGELNRLTLILKEY